MYLLPKIHKRLSNVPGRPVISNYGTPIRKVSKFLDFQLKLVMQNSKSYIKDSGDFIRKIKDIQYIPCYSGRGWTVPFNSPRFWT